MMVCLGGSGISFFDLRTWRSANVMPRIRPDLAALVFAEEINKFSLEFVFQLRDVDPTVAQVGVHFGFPGDLVID